MERAMSRWELTPVQRQVFDALRDKEINGHSLGDWYLGAICVLRDKHNPERISHASQSMRELLEKLPEVILEAAVGQSSDAKNDQSESRTRREDLQKNWEKVKRRYKGTWLGKKVDGALDKTLRKIDKYLSIRIPTRAENIHLAIVEMDPMSDSLDPLILEKKLTAFRAAWKVFQACAHHGSKPEEAAFNEYISYVEQLILELLAPTTAPDQQKIIAGLRKPAPSITDMDRVLDLAERNGANYTFFFKHVQEPTWIPILKKQGFFDRPSAGELHEDGQLRFRLWQPLLFLQRVANAAPDQVVDILANLPETDNPRTSHRICVIASEMDDIESSLKLSPWVNTYIKSSNSLDSRPIIDLLHRWRGGADDARAAALDLMKLVVRFHPDPESDAKKERRKVKQEPLDFLTFNPEPSPRFSEWDYRQLLERGVRPLAEVEPFQVASILINATTRMIHLSSYQDNDEAISWVRLDQADEIFSDFSTTLIHALTYACESVYRNAPNSVEDLDRSLRNRPWKLFERLRQHLYAKNPSDQTLPWIREFILKHTDYAGVSYDYEFQQMLRTACEHFGSSLLSAEEWSKIFDEILKGPSQKWYPVVTGFSGAHFTEEGAENWQRFHHRKKLRPFANLLFGLHQTYYRELESKFSDISLSDEDYLPYRSGPGGFVSYVSPQSRDRLALQEDENLLTFINEWEDEHEDSEDWLKRITIRGLADEFQILFRDVICFQGERLNFWMENRDKIERPIYVKAIVQAFQEHIREHHFQWLDDSFEFCQWVLTHPDEGSDDGVQRHEDFREHPDWGSSRWAVVDFVATCLDEKVGIPFNTKHSLGRILTALCNQFDWRLDRSEPFFSSRDDQIDEAINNTRSRSLLHLIGFGIWIRRHAPDDKLYEITSVLEERFGIDAEFPFTMPERALLGSQFGNLFALNQDWATEHRQKFFPQEDQLTWVEAFGNFLILNHSCSPFFEILKNDYEFAIDCLSELGKVKSSGKNALDRLGQHLFDYYAWGFYSLNGEGSLLEKFYSNSSDDRERWANLFNHVGSSLSRSRKALEKDLMDRVDAFFHWRFQEGEPEELRLFGFWLKADCLDPDWRLDALMKLLNLEQWKDRRFFFMLESLEGMLGSHKGKVVECFARITETLNHGSLYPRDAVRAIVVAGLSSEDESINRDAERARENLLRGGEFDLSDFEE